MSVTIVVAVHLLFGIILGVAVQSDTQKETEKQKIVSIQTDHVVVKGEK